MQLLPLLVACSDPCADRAGCRADTGGALDTGETAESGDDAGRQDHADLPTSDDVDVLVVGAGPAGLAAARAALELGATVRVLEREEGVGGSALLAGGLMLFSGSPEQAAVGIVDSPEQLAKEWPAFTGGDVTDPWFGYFAAHNVDRVHDWLAPLGLAWLPPGPDPSAGATWRAHEVIGGGAALVEGLAGALPVEIVRVHAQVDDLAFDAGGRVIGVAWTNVATGERLRALGRATVVATGGFAANLERVLEERPDLPAAYLARASWAGADGGGLALLEGYGAATENLGAIGVYAHGILLADPPQGEVLAPLLPQVPWVNAAGERFCDESQTNSFLVGATRAAQPDGAVWAVFDDAAAGASPLLREDGTVVTIQELEAAGLGATADSLRSLADELGVDGDAFTASVATFNAWAAGEDDPFREPGAPGDAVNAPPFHALTVAASVAKGFGGVSVDLGGRVVDVDGAPIPGLYAAGELTGMIGGSIVGSWGFTGSLSAVVLGGRIAGETAAAESATTESATAADAG